MVLLYYDSLLSNCQERMCLKITCFVTQSTQKVECYIVNCRLWLTINFNSSALLSIRAARGAS